MPEFAPEQLAAWTGGRWTSPPAAAPTGFAIDTRKLRRGEAFVAIRSESRDGHDFLAAAAEAGAIAAIVARPIAGARLPQLVVADPLAAFQAVARAHRRRFSGPVIGVTGSAGKTSTKNLLAALLGEEPRVLATEGNLNNHLGVPLTLTRLDPAVHHYAVIEAGIGAPGEMAPLAAMIEPSLAVVTLIAPAHLERFSSLEATAREKAVLPAAVGPPGAAIFPGSCLEFAAFRDLAVAKLVVGADAPRPPRGGAEERISLNITHQAEATTLTLAGGIYAGTFALPQVSEGMARNAALAVCAALRLGLPAGALRPRLAAWRPAALRGELRREGGRLLYLDCYNANPASMADALAAFEAVAPAAEPRLYILGGMEELGPDSPRYHRELGWRLRLRAGDFAFLLGPQAAAAHDGALEKGNPAERMAVVDTLAPIAERLAAFAGSVFIKGSRKYALESLLPAAAPAPA
ncbi:MAG TPA: UDP-N-acetylmuramoyl-tripeptide--D-alanyl-D-alanine ligase [Opitutaceae bacterium]|jgi:UDP-N-acetylmuramoyl-tripeptide--D-alanyl-D-alanine ligase|nr:UDP-N-acetylmuramoyl-tripeptide--D-alanyl-D-alanine ligase [Opitutaceae bacterium]